VDGDFLRPLITTLIVGSLIVGTGATLLFFALRAAREPQGGERRFVTIAAVLIAFVFICCVLFFIWSIVS
jgi:hypothetical protein